MRHSLFPNQSRRRQNRDPLYKESSTIYATKLSVLKERKSIFGDFLVPLIIPLDEAIDVNVEFDFQLIKLLLEIKKILPN